MSYWTHIDGEMILSNITPKEIRKTLGTPYDWCDMHGRDILQNILGKIFYKGKLFKVRKNKLFRELLLLERRIICKRAERKYFYEGNPIPAGSEGSIQYNISKYNKGMYKVEFHGNLRDVWEYQSTLDWIDRLSKVENEWEECISSCEVTINMEGIEPYMFYRESYANKYGTYWNENRIVNSKDYDAFKEYDRAKKIANDGANAVCG